MSPIRLSSIAAAALAVIVATVTSARATNITQINTDLSFLNDDNGFSQFNNSDQLVGFVGSVTVTSSDIANLPAVVNEPFFSSVELKTQGLPNGASSFTIEQKSRTAYTPVPSGFSDASQGHSGMAPFIIQNAGNPASNVTLTYTISQDVTVQDPPGNGFTGSAMISNSSSIFAVANPGTSLGGLSGTVDVDSADVGNEVQTTGFYDGFTVNDLGNGSFNVAGSASQMITVPTNVPHELTFNGFSLIGAGTVTNSNNELIAVVNDNTLVFNISVPAGFSLSIPAQVIPEPGSAAVVLTVGLMLAGAAGRGRRQR